MKNSRFWEVLLKVIVAAATAAITSRPRHVWAVAHLTSDV